MCPFRGSTAGRSTARRRDVPVGVQARVLRIWRVCCGLMAGRERNKDRQARRKPMHESVPGDTLEIHGMHQAVQLGGY